MNFKKSFNELKKPIIWLHYLIGTLAIYAFFRYVLNVPLTYEIGYLELFVFYIVYIVIDRTVHALLDI
jgi:hypothetical protein